MSAATAQVLNQMMRAVVDRGTGTNAQIAGVAVAGKTGTAQNNTPNPHAWFIGFAPADAPRVAVAVIMEHQGSGSDFATPAAGGRGRGARLGATRARRDRAAGSRWRSCARDRRRPPPARRLCQSLRVGAGCQRRNNDVTSRTTGS
jgi:membrane peptidoglycan carboxypeptidase